MGKNARHNYQSSDFRALVCFMAKDLGYNDKKIASTLGLQLIYFAHIVSMIPELSDALEKAREELINEEKHGHNGRLGRKIVSVTVTAIPDINPDLL